MNNENLDLINSAIDIVLLSLAILQQISGKSKEEVLEMIKSESLRTDELIDKLR